MLALYMAAHSWCKAFYVCSGCAQVLLCKRSMQRASARYRPREWQDEFTAQVEYAEGELAVVPIGCYAPRASGEGRASDAG